MAKSFTVWWLVQVVQLHGNLPSPERMRAVSPLALCPWRCLRSDGTPAFAQAEMMVRGTGDPLSPYDDRREQAEDTVYGVEATFGTPFYHHIMEVRERMRLINDERRGEEVFDSDVEF